MNKQKNDLRRFQQFPMADDPRWIPVPKWIRTCFAGKFMADSRKVMLMRGFPAVYYFPRQDVAMDLLETSKHLTSDEKLGEATYWHVKVGDSIAKNAAWSYENPTGNAPENLSQYIAFDWKSMDSWFEEDEIVRVHPRDPYVRIDTIFSSRHVKIILKGQIVAESARPLLLFETGLPTRYYFQHTDVRMDLFKPTAHQTACPYKGVASYYSFISGDKKVANIAWTYPYPNPEVLKIKDLICFYTERADELIVDGQTQPVPRKPGFNF